MGVGVQKCWWTLSPKSYIKAKGTNYGMLEKNLRLLPSPSRQTFSLIRAHNICSPQPVLFIPMEGWRQTLGFAIQCSELLINELINIVISEPVRQCQCFGCSWMIFFFIFNIQYIFIKNVLGCISVHTLHCLKDALHWNHECLFCSSEDKGILNQ